MSPKCDVPKLIDCALTELAQGVVRAISNLQSELDVDLRLIDLTSYFESSGATNDIYQDMLQTILCSEYLDPAARSVALQLFLKENVSFLATGIFPFAYYERILQLIAMQGAGLKTLNLKGVWVKEDHMFYLFEIVKRLKKLDRLNVPYIANDELLKHISEQCRNLKVLDVSGESDITEIGLQFLYTGLTKNTLTVVDIGILGEENVCHTDIAELILQLPNLTNLVSYSFVGKSLRHICENKRVPNFQSKLQYVHDTNTDTASLRSILKCCSSLESLYLDNPQRGVVSELANFKLNKLKLNNFKCDELHNTLGKIGNRLHQLTLLQGKGVLDFTEISRSCPNIVELECYMMEMLNHCGEVPFRQLEVLEVLHCSVNSSTLKYLLTKSPNLKRLAIGDDVKLTDADVHRLCSEHEFPNLEDIWFPNASSLTPASVEVLMDRCPMLTSLGQLSGWCVTPDDLMMLRAIVSSTNTKLALSPAGIFP